MQIIDRVIAAVAPGWAFHRLQMRSYLAAYEAAQPGRHHKGKRSGGSGDEAAKRAVRSLREQARYLDENHDLAAGILDVLETRVVGPAGLGIEPQPKTVSGEIAEGVALQLFELFEDWAKRPEVTWQHDWVAAQKLVFRSWARDGEALAVKNIGRIPGLDHGTKVPFSLELLEADFIADDRDKSGGIRLNAWGRPLEYTLYKSHPGGAAPTTATKTVRAEFVLHPKMVKRLHQYRGVSIFANVLQRLEDIKSYEESERIAARISAAMAAYIKKGTPEMYVAENKAGGRRFSLQPGQFFDNLQVGEEVGTIQSNRPSALLAPFRDAMLRAAASGTRAGYSAIAKNYGGSYASQRQELVEQQLHYESMAAAFISQFIRPVWEAFVQAALAAGLVDVPAEVVPESLYDADFIAPPMPWIDPMDEAQANELLARSGQMPLTEQIRSRGRNPIKVFQTFLRERGFFKKNELVFSSDASNDAARVTGAPAAAPPKKDRDKTD